MKDSVHQPAKHDCLSECKVFSQYKDVGRMEGSEKVSEIKYFR